MANEPSVDLAMIGIVATLVAGLIWLLKKQFVQNETTLANGNKIIDKNTNVIEKLCTLIDTMQVNSIRHDEENKVFQQYVIESLKAIIEKADRNHTAIKDMSVTTQNVGTQIIEHSTVKEKP